MHLIKQNYRILKRYDLSIIAYNSGLRHLFKAKRKLCSSYDLFLCDGSILPMTTKALGKEFFKKG